MEVLVAFDTPPSSGGSFPDTAAHAPPIIKVRPDPLLGRLVRGRYRIISRIARGGMASVYLARDAKIGDLRAIKVLRGDLVLDSRVRERFLNESLATQMIEHPGIVQIVDVGEVDGGRLCLVMEYVDGESLRLALDKGPFSTQRAIDVAIDMAEALAIAHENGVVHRDLKPENVLLPRTPGNSLVKIVDFGIARILDAPRITTTRHIMGTPQYIAPEQARGERVDWRADIYALGILMYELLTGELPFAGQDPDTLLRQHINAPPPPLVTKLISARAIPGPLEKLVMACLAKNPLDRPQSMEELSTRLQGNRSF
jgi:serine/threonine-protein kinase